MDAVLAIDELADDADLLPLFARSLPALAHTELASDLSDVRCATLVNKAGIGASTNSNLKRDSAVMMSSTMPSAKYSCSGRR